MKKKLRTVGLPVLLSDLQLQQHEEHAATEIDKKDAIACDLSHIGEPQGPVDRTLFQCLIIYKSDCN